jgi:hypothetical protein
VIQVFRREKAPYSVADFTLGGIDSVKTYVFEDTDGGQFTVGGRSLCENGFSVRINERRGSKIYFYRAEDFL